MSHTFRVAHQEELNNILREWKLPLYFTKPVMNHIVHYLDGILSKGCTGTLTEIHREGRHHRDRRTLSHFLAHGKWNESFLLRIAQHHSWKSVLHKANQSNAPIFVLLDDTVCQKTKPSSQAQCPIQGATFHHSHTLGKLVWGHNMVQTMLCCEDRAIPFAFARYEPNQKSKIEIACDLLRQIPKSNSRVYALMDSWYPSERVLNTCIQQGFQVISGLKTNRICYPQGIRQSLKQFAAYITERDTSIVTVGENTYRVYRYEGKLNALENAVVLLCWNATQPMTPQAMRAFLSTDASLTNDQILCYYSKRWAIETYFRTMKGKVSLDRYQVRNTRAIDRYWILALFSAVFCIHIGQGQLIDGLNQWRQNQTLSWIDFVFAQTKSGVSLEQIKKQLQVA